MTKQTIIIATLLFSQYLRLEAQYNSKSDYIVLSIGDSLYGTVAYIKENAVNRDFYKKVRLTNANGKTKKYKPESISSFRINGNKYQSFWLYQPPQTFPSVSLVNPRYNIDSKQGDHYFLRVISIGRLSHYQLEWFDQGDSQLWSMALLKKANDQYFIRADQGIIGLKKKLLQRYFTDCLELAKKIKNSELKKVWQVVEAYNHNCH